MNYTKAEVWVGAVVLAGAALLVGAVVTVLNVEAMFQPTARLQVYYQNVKGLKPGAVVQLNGVPVGTVGDVSLLTLDLTQLPADRIQNLKDKGWIIPPHAGPDQPWQMAAVSVTLEVPDRLVPQIHPNSLIVVIKSLTGQIVVDIEYSGGTSEAWTGQTFWGPETTLFTDAARELGIGDEQRQNLKSILRNAQILTANLTKFSGSLQAINAKDFEKAKAWIRKTLENVSAAAENIEKLVNAEKGDLPKLAAELRQSLQGVQDNLKRTMANVESASAKIDRFMDQANRLADNVNATFTRESLQQVVRTVREASASLKTLLGRAQGAVASVNDVLAENRPTVRRIVENVEDASAYLRLTLKDLNRRPWRLIKGPGPEEDTEAAHLYRALREFNEGASDLELVSEQLRAVLAGQTSPTKDRDEAIHRLQKRLEHVSKTFQQLEKKLWERLGKKER